MTQQDDITQRVLTAEQDPINAAILLLTEEADSISDCHTRTPGDWAGEPEAKAHYDHVRSVVDALSKLRAPVADEREQHDNWYSRTHMHEYSRDATWRGWQARAALASAPVACNCPGGNKPVDLHAPNCPVRTAKATLIDPYDGGTWLASAPVADEHCSASNPQVFSVEQLEKDPLLVARLWRKPADTDGSLVERIMEHVSEYGESMASSSLLSVRTIARRNLEARIEAELADAMRSQDESPLREALSEIASAWSARTRLPEEDGIQALKDIARAALASAPVADEKPDESNSPVPLAGHSMGPLTPIYDHVGSLIGQALATARHGAYEGSIVWTRMRHAGEWMPWHVAGKQSAPVAGEAQPLGYVLKGREWPNQCYYPSSHKPTDIHNWTPVFDHAAPQVSPVAAEAQPSRQTLLDAIWRHGNARAMAEHNIAYRDEVRNTADALIALFDAAPQASAEPQQYTHSEVFGPMESAWNAALDQAAAVAKRISDKYAFGHYGNETDTADEIEREILALKQPQADKDGGQQPNWISDWSAAIKSLPMGRTDAEGIRSQFNACMHRNECRAMLDRQQRAGDVDERAAFEAWAYRAGMGPKFRESMFAAWEARAALSAPQAEQGERDA